MKEFTYKGLRGSVTKSVFKIRDGSNGWKDDTVYSGRILDIYADIGYEAGTLEDARREFRKEVDKYLARDCR